MSQLLFFRLTRAVKNNNYAIAVRCRASFSTATTIHRQHSPLNDGKTLRDFMAPVQPTPEMPSAPLPPFRTSPPLQDQDHSTPPVIKCKKVYIETYGCQMNFNDTEILLGILKQQQGLSTVYERIDDVEKADVVFLMTCAIRENAEAKIWSRLDELNAIEKRRRGGMTIGVLGCMAERLKTEVLERKRNVDIVCGPDAYRDLPRLLEDALEGQSGINVILSADETYADIAPVRLDATKRSAFVSIMRGCNNMCAFCIVPFTRGRERSRPVESIVEEVRRLSAEGIKEITLLGQNVNSYCDESVLNCGSDNIGVGGGSGGNPMDDAKTDVLSRGFKTIYKPKVGGRRFADLLERVSAVDPEMRIRFTSPHPKDFPDELLWLMRDRRNICKQIHLPAQSGSTAVLERMRRGYTREAYLELVNHIREIIPHVSFSSDFISGFCGETDEDHKMTLSLMETVGYDMAYMYAYSMREKTMAHRRYEDNVPEEVKQQRLSEVVALFYSGLSQRVKSLIGTRQLVLVEGQSKKSASDLAGKADNGKTIVFPSTTIFDPVTGTMRQPAVGDYVDVYVEKTSGATPVARALSFSSITGFQQPQKLDPLRLQE